MGIFGVEGTALPLYKEDDDEDDDQYYVQKALVKERRLHGDCEDAKDSGSCPQLALCFPRHLF